MASGGYHGGSSHSGGFHSSSGGSSSGGGSSGGGYSGGYGDFGGGSPGEGFMVIGVIILAITLFIFAHIQKGTIPGINLISLSLYAITGFAFIPGIKSHKRVAEIERIRFKHVIRSDSGISSEFISPVRRGTKETWVGKNDKNFRISFKEERFGDKNLIRVKEMMRKRPVTVLLWPKVFLVIAVIWFLSAPFIAEFTRNLLVPRPISVKKIDEIVKNVSYVQAGLTLIFPILSTILVKVRENLLYKFAVKIVDENDKELMAESAADSETK